jgi:dsRNA-specific ribonuclease
VPPNARHHARTICRSTARRCATAAPFTDERPDLPNNERLEFLGDAVLDAVIGSLLFHAYTRPGRRLPHAHAEQAREPRSN